MPYWKEYHVSDFKPTSGVNRTSLGDGTVVETARYSGAHLSSASIQNTYRSGRGRGNAAVVLVDDSVADPFSLYRPQIDLNIRAAKARGFDVAWTVDRGHPWELIKISSSGSFVTAKLRNKSPAFYTWEVTGAVPFSVNTTGVISGFRPPASIDLEAAGRDLYGKAAPPASKFNVPQFLGELREGLPRLALETFTRANFFRGLGSDYLNVQFGWKPFLSDLRSAFEALTGASTVLFGPIGPVHRYRSAGKQFTSGFNRPTNFVLSTKTEGFQHFDYVPLKKIVDFTSGTQFGFLSAETLVSSRTEQRTWFEGDFMYLPKVGFNPDSYLDRLNALMDTEITPSVLWELSPWSWLTDWFLHIGDAINAAETASDSRILSSHAYAMSEDIHVNGILASNIRASSTSRVYEGPSSAAHEWTTVRKRRIRANPYGFGVNPTTSLNAGQWAILAALGFTKTRG